MVNPHFSPPFGRIFVGGPVYLQVKYLNLYQPAIFSLELKKDVNKPPPKRPFEANIYITVNLGFCLHPSKLTAGTQESLVV